MTDPPPPLVVGVNLLFIQPDRNLGTYTYVKNVLSAISEDPHVRLIIFANKVNSDLIAREIPGERVECPVRGDNLAARVIYEQTVLGGRAAGLGCDVLWCPGYLAPVTSRLPVVVTIHDMQYRDIPESVGRIKRVLYGLIVPRGARHAARVIAVSHFSKERIVYYTGVPTDRVVVTHEASFISPEQIGNAPRDPDALRRLELAPGYLLSVSSGLPHKNIPRLITAFHRATRDTRQQRQLVFAGAPATPEAARAAEQCGGAVRFLGYLPDDLLRRVYEGAHAFVLASYYEGFGLPVLEAMQCGVPVACSHAASLPEVAGDAAVYFDPFSTESIAAALTTLLGEDDDQRAARIQQGRRNLERFSWRKCADETLDVLRRAAAASAR